MSIAISNNTKLDVPMNIQRNKELPLKLKLRIPNTNPKQYYNLTAHKFKMKIIDADGNQKYLFDNNRFGVDSDFQRTLLITSDETEAFDPQEKYYYDLHVIYPDLKKDYWTHGRIYIADRITT